MLIDLSPLIILQNDLKISNILQKYEARDLQFLIQMLLDFINEFGFIKE